MNILALILSMWLVTAVQAAPQVPARDAGTAPVFGTASVSGVVVNDADPAVPVRRAIVTLTGGGLRPSRGAITDDQGRFVIGGLPAGRFTLTVSRSGFVSSVHGAKRAGRAGTPLVVADNARVENLTVKLWRGAVVSGTLRDDTGAPVTGVRVHAVPAKVVVGATPTLTNNGSLTDDRGEYRIFGLEPGTYVIAARPASPGGGPLSALSEEEVDKALAELRSGSRRTPAKPSEPPAPLPTFAYAQVYFPGTATMAYAEPIVLAAGQEKDGLDFALSRVPTATVEGVVIRTDGKPAAGTELQLSGVDVSSRFVSGPPVMISAKAGPDGRFRIPQVTPGDYRLIARAEAAPAEPQPRADGMVVVMAGPTGQQLWATTRLAVSGSDISGITLSLEPGAEFTGRIQFTGATPAPTSGFAQLRVGFSPLEGIINGVVRTIAFTLPSQVNPDGSFELVGVPPGRFRFSVYGLAFDGKTWTLRSATSGGRDLLDTQVEIVPGGPPSEIALVYSDQAVELSGRLQTPSGGAVSEVFVIAFATDKSLWGPGARRVQAVRPDVDGAYVMRGLPAGQYFLAAVTDIDQDEWEDASFLAGLVPAAITITMREGERSVHDLRLAVK